MSHFQNQDFEVSNEFLEVQKKVDTSTKRNYRRVSIGFLILFIYCFVTSYQFGLFDIGSRWFSDRVSLMLLDTYANKDHIIMHWDNTSKISVRFEGSKKMTYDPQPDFLIYNNDGNFNTMVFTSGRKVNFYKNFIELEGYSDVIGKLRLGINNYGKPAILSDQKEIPKWIRVTENKIEVRPNLFERIQIYKSKVVVHRYQVGWRYFFFDFDSLLRDFSFYDIVKISFSSDRITPELGNNYFILQEFLNNSIWFHGPVFFALLETIMMALIGTLIASIIGLFLSFLAASNINPFKIIRIIVKRFFDFLRAVDTLIWSLLLLRAFGPGLFTGIFAIALTEIGTLGKLMSEAIENTDPNQQEGVASTGASTLQKQRYGILPQIMPVFISQTLYTLESNTRSAIIIGAMGSGGIGMLFLSYMRTGVDFENVAYVAALVLITVMLMDLFSSWLRNFIINS